MNLGRPMIGSRVASLLLSAALVVALVAEVWALQAGAAAPVVPDLAAAAAVGPVSTAAYGARCVGAAYDDTLAFQAAIDTGNTVYAPAMGGHCHITRPLVMRVPGQIFGGDGRARTVILVEPGFAGQGVFVAHTGEPGPVWRDFSVSFVQPDVDNRAKLTRYPPAFYARDTPRFEIEHVGCYVATTCVDMRGNGGGATIADFQMSAFEVGIDIDGSLDTVRLLSLHGWPFGAAGPRQVKQIEDNVTWVRLGRVDDVKIVDGMFLSGIGLALRASSLGVATGSVTNSDFDGSHRAIDMSAGNLSVTGGYFASGGPNDQQVVLTGGVLGIYAATIGCSSGGVATKLPALDVNGTQAFLTIVGSPSFLCGGDDRTILQIHSGAAIFNSNNIMLTPNKPYLYPKIEILGSASRLTAIGNRIGDKGSGAGVFVALESSNFNRVVGNVAPGWTMLLKGQAIPPMGLVPNPGAYFAN